MTGEDTVADGDEVECGDGVGVREDDGRAGDADDRVGDDDGRAGSDDNRAGDDDRGYRHVAVEEVANTPNPTRVKRELDEAVGASLFGCNYYEADPGERVPWGYHRHPDHEEMFYVIAGELAVETPDRTYRVGPDEAFFVPENAPNRAVAAGDEPCRFLALGAPKDADGAVIEEACPACGAVTDREYEVQTVDAGVNPDVTEYVLSCAECGETVDRFSA
ncbi:cupin domain-containing protein [Halobaculum sp. CBA1158]|uniref:cupin domain-containing protein n=1 Tax=Halobaculum sp. CBA1158 TaxID=2904243 RepID=UPI001F16CC30|nr:cupin domain-containing protein [Halobaculum sp. CBA1158]UIP01078.1 cupin domain-containing protein [Halobaculum sp. CBA1158]